jgi:hypothetical protein
MPTLLGKQSTPQDDTTMVIYRGSRKPLDPSRKRDLAKRCGVEFIRLIYKDNLTSTIGISGFQHVKIRTQPRKGGGVEPVAQWHKNIYTSKPMAEGSLAFVPDEMGTGYAYLPDSSFNRVRLAAAEIGQNALWIIEDKKIHSEICELAEEIRKSIEYQKAVENDEKLKIEVEMRVQENNVKNNIVHKSRIEIEIGVLEKRVKDMEIKKKRDVLKMKLLRLQESYLKEQQEEIQQSTKSEVQDTQENEDVLADNPIDNNSEDEFLDLIDENDNSENDELKMELLKKQAKTEIHSGNKELIESVKSKYLKRTGKQHGWAFSPEYRRLVHPLIENRLKELIAENEHATISVAD